MIPQAFFPIGAAPSSDYDIGNSLRFNSADGTYLSWTPGSEDSVLTCACLSFWVKRSTVSAVESKVIFGSGTAGAYARIYFTSNNELVVDINNTGYVQTSAVFIDVTNWYHIVVMIDSTLGTATDRIKLWVNGDRITSWADSGTLAINTTLSFGKIVTHAIGRDWSGASYIFDGYIADAIVITGVALAATDFGSTLSFSTIDPLPIYGGTASASSDWSADYEAANAFDERVTGDFVTWYTDEIPTWLQYNYGSSKIITKYAIQGAFDGAGCGNTAMYPNSWDFLGSNNGSTWTTLDSRTTSWTTLGEKQTFVIATPQSFQYYRLNCFNSSGGLYVTVGELMMYEDTLGAYWRPKAYTGAYGTNGFYLPFNDGTSTTTLGYDRSGNANNWTLNNFSVTAGIGNDWSLDTPTNNYATWNPIDVLGAYASTTLVNGALHANDFLHGAAYGTIAASTDKWYWEVVQTGTNAMIGVICPNSLTTGSYSYSCLSAYGIYPQTTAIYQAGASSGGPYSGAGTYMFALDPVNKKLWVGKSGSWTGDPVAGTGNTFTLPADYDLWTPWWHTASGASCDVNFGNNGTTYDSTAKGWFNYTPPSGFKALCAKNLSDSPSVITSGSFSGNASANGPFVYLGGSFTNLFIDGNLVIWGTHADKFANGFKLRTASSPYNQSGTRNFIVTAGSAFKKSNAQRNP